MIAIKYGIRLSDMRQDWVIDVPARSLDHAEEVVRWHNDPKHESCYEASVIVRQVITTNWMPYGQPARNVVP